MADVLTKEQRHHCMSNIKGKDTNPELVLRKALWSTGLRYRLNCGLLGRPDIVFPRQRLAIFVDGCFWHGCPQHCQMPKTNQKFWENKLFRNMSRDKEVTELLEQKGWNVERFWEHEIKDDISLCVQRVYRLIRKKNS